MTRRIREQVTGNREQGKSFLLAAVLAVTCNLFPVPSSAATKLFLKGGVSPIVGPTSGTVFKYYVANTNQGSTAAGDQTTSTAGPLTGHYWPISTTGYIVTDNAGRKTAWFSPPLSSGVTISGTITPNIWGFESANQCNCGFRYEVLRWSAAEGGIVSSLGISADSGASEWGTSASVRTSPTLAPASTDFSSSDRIVIIMYNDDGNGITQANNRSWTLRIDGPTGADGDTYLSFTETLSFSSDTNNARPLPMLSLLLRLESLWREFWEATLS